jgi:hypothetical protein
MGRFRPSIRNLLNDDGSAFSNSSTIAAKSSKVTTVFDPNVLTPHSTKMRRTSGSKFFQEQFERMTVQINDDACVK